LLGLSRTGRLDGDDDVIELGKVLEILIEENDVAGALG